MEFNKAASFLKEHPVLIISISAFICSGIGYFNEYYLLKKFGLNITSFADVDDFFLAGLKHPAIFSIIFPITIITVAMLSNMIDKRVKEICEFEIKKERHISKTIEKALVKTPEITEEKITKDARKKARPYQIIIWLKLPLFIFAFTYFNSKGNFYNILHNPQMESKLLLRTGDTIPKSNEPPLIFITATGKFMFFYQKTSENEIKTIVVPTASITEMTYSNLDFNNSPKNDVKLKDKSTSNNNIENQLIIEH